MGEVKERWIRRYPDTGTREHYSVGFRGNRSLGHYWALGLDCCGIESAFTHSMAYGLKGDSWARLLLGCREPLFYLIELASHLDC